MRKFHLLLVVFLFAALIVVGCERKEKKEFTAQEMIQYITSHFPVDSRSSLLNSDEFIRNEVTPPTSEDSNYIP